MLKTIVDLDVREKDAIALFDFRARNEKELSLKKGDTVQLHTRVSSEWWRGSSGGRTGLIPHNYIAVQTRCDLCFLHTVLNTARCYEFLVVTFAALLSERRRYCGAWHPSVTLCVCSPSRDCTNVALVSAAKVMRCTQYSLVRICISLLSSARRFLCTCM